VFGVELDRQLPVGAPVTLLGHGVTAEAHALAADTIAYEIVTGIRADPLRSRRSVVDS
jgi:alanine racemase